MAVLVSNNSRVMTARIEGDIDHHTAKDIREKIDLELRKFSPKMLMLDFGQVQFMDSSGIGLIMGRFKLVTALGGKLSVVNIPKRLERMIKLSGLAALGIFEKGGKI